MDEEEIKRFVKNMDRFMEEMDRATDALRHMYSAEGRAEQYGAKIAADTEMAEDLGMTMEDMLEEFGGEK